MACYGGLPAVMRYGQDHRAGDASQQQSDGSDGPCLLVNPICPSDILGHKSHHCGTLLRPLPGRMQEFYVLQSEFYGVDSEEVSGYFKLVWILQACVPVRRAVSIRL